MVRKDTHSTKHIYQSAVLTWLTRLVLLELLFGLKGQCLNDVLFIWSVEHFPLEINLTVIIHQLKDISHIIYSCEISIFRRRMWLIY